MTRVFRETIPEPGTLLGPKLCVRFKWSTGGICGNNNSVEVAFGCMQSWLNANTPNGCGLVKLPRRIGGGGLLGRQLLVC